eukprot:scaffold127190_cov20-Tisochrysis_lutea.AAC.1
MFGNLNSPGRSDAHCNRNVASSCVLVHGFTISSSLKQSIPAHPFCVKSYVNTKDHHLKLAWFSSGREVATELAEADKSFLSYGIYLVRCHSSSCGGGSYSTRS